MGNLNKSFNFKDIEEKLYKRWENLGLFKPNPKSDKPKFTMMMPPPNVTGRLHIGHSLNYTLQDILARHKRMQGFDVFWQPGTDHAGIATQMLVERSLKEIGKTRQELGREEFIKKIWEWKEEKGNAIVEQQRRIGISCDWSKQRFTMDEGLSKSVRKVFVDLFNEGLIYKDKRLVNWDTKFQTAISDLEVENEDRNGIMFYVKYKIKDSKNSIIIATTRPETIPADVAIAVHPKDPRYKDLIGKLVNVPSTDRFIPIISDEYCDMEKGSGAVKITPAHDFNDFEVGKRHNLTSINLLNKDGTINNSAPDFLQGLTVNDARKSIVEFLKSNEILEKEETINHPVPVAERSRCVVEPFLADQWFVDVKSMANRAMTAVSMEESNFVPKQWVNTYNRWLEDIQPWCVSRQIWWGHQIPAWYGPDGHIFVEESEETAIESAKNHYGKDVELNRDKDVLDTWFSSALWPFSTLDWPNENEMLEKYYPTSVIVTGLDIIFFWIARMLMMGLHFTDKTPFKDIFIHALVRDEKGNKMSKTKGNVIDPIILMDKFGTDAMRFALAQGCVPGRDVRMGEKRVETTRNFMTKIYNAAKFLEHYECKDFKVDFDNIKSDINAWILSTFKEMREKSLKSLDVYRFDEMSSIFYDFFWKNYCDQYLELIKTILCDEKHEYFNETKNVALYIFLESLKWIHPVIPFITEELWQNFKGSENILMESQITDIKIPDNFKNMTLKCEHILNVIQNVRAIRGMYNISHSEFLKLIITSDDISCKENSEVLKKMARLSELEFSKSFEKKGCSSFICEGVTFIIPLHGAIDMESEKNRLEKILKKVEKELESTQSRLNNKKFMENASDDVINEMHERLKGKKLYLEKISKAIEILY